MKQIKIFFLSLISWGCFAQSNDTIFIKFSTEYSEMKKETYKFSEESEFSFGYFIRQMEKETYGDIYFVFSHSQRDKKHNAYFGSKNSPKLYKPKSFIEGKKVLDINFFRTTPYFQIAKTFEKEDSWEQDVVIFMVDVDEIKNDNIVLREVRFSRPVKE